MRRALIVLGFLIVAACGADGPPEPQDTGIAVSGQARIGVVGTL